MKIRAVDSCVLTVPTPKPIALQFPQHKLVVAEISTDAGVSGLGYSLAFGGGGAEAIQVYLDTRLKPVLIGEDPLFVERLWERMFRADMGIRKQGIAAYALSALDIGLWDIAGKVAGLPLYQLWGAVTDRIPAYGSGGWARYSVEDLVGEAERYAGLGCRYYKMKIHHPDPRENRKRVEAVRRALGERVRLMVDVNQRLDVLGNIRQAALLEDLDLVWYEEPVLADDIAACAEVSEKIRIPRADRAPRGALPDARCLPRQRLQRNAAHRPPGSRALGRRLAARRARALAARRGRARQRLSRRVHRLDTARPVRGNAALQGRPLPDPAPFWPRHGPRQGRCQEVPQQRIIELELHLS